MSERLDLIARYQQGESISSLARAFGLSRTTVYQWVRRVKAAGAVSPTERTAALTDRSRRPHTSPGRTPEAVRTQVLDLAAAQPTWGARKLHHALLARGVTPVPAPSTIAKLLAQAGRGAGAPPGPTPYQRFEAADSNALWQLDFKGWGRLQRGAILPWTLLDDHSRYLLACHGLAGSQPCAFAVFQPLLIAQFRRYGLPWAILCDNGPPWGTSEPDALTRFDVWCLQLGIRPIHGRPLHPQTQGKLERLHRTLQADVFAGGAYPDLATAQRACDRFRHVYNHERPHEALAYQVPATRYHGSDRAYPETLPEPVYGDDAAVRTVAAQGTIHYAGHVLRIGGAFAGHQVGVMPTAVDGIVQVQFFRYPVRTIDYPVRTIDLRDLTPPPG
jgi:transposase InsO family protein